jgi:hypothetical protein
MNEEKISSKIKSKRTRAPKKDYDEEGVHIHYHTDEPGARRKKESKSDSKQEIHYHYYYEPSAYAPKRRSSKPGIAGALMILTAILGIISAVLLISGSVFVGGMGEGFEFFGDDGKGDINGTITFLNGTPVENATISIVGEPLSTQTDDEGNYIIYNVPSGNHEIKIEKEGYNTIIYKTFIGPSDFKFEQNHDNRNSDSENEFDFVLTPGSEELERGTYPPFQLLGGFMVICGIVIIILSIVTIFGGYYALQRRKFGFVIAGAILGLFTGIGIIFALIAIFILVLSRDEFRAPNYNEQ